MTIQSLPRSTSTDAPGDCTSLTWPMAITAVRLVTLKLSLGMRWSRPRPTTVEGLAVVLSYIAAWQGEDDGACAHAGDLLTAIRSAAASAEILASGSKAA